MKKRLRKKLGLGEFAPADRVVTLRGRWWRSSRKRRLVKHLNWMANRPEFKAQIERQMMDYLLFGAAFHTVFLDPADFVTPLAG